MKRMIGLLLFAMLVTFDVRAETPVLIPSINLSGTITTTSTFQTIQAVNNGRLGCTIQNNGTHTMYVYFGPPANATTAASAQLLAGLSLNCWITPGYVLKDTVSITGTSGDAFYANFQ